ncbi:MAG: mycofactocin biosynthesis chaperone MftB [Acidimicrobiia bacterium]|nr:mycofactocin biosynthesis chaperone MftB [Acidimicrobiia bacterium]MBA3982728.1 mycofactocin biosynthesis chaperone MftB [Acidimicrobiia bacterium]MDQ3390368.1 mycofactocin biosynthesis chaperone MftB [Actinomycetota bacterium]
MLDRVLTRHPQVALRPEPFGALAYHYDNRKLIFLRHPDLLTVVQSLDGRRTVAEALDVAGVASSRRPSFLAALQSLLDSEMLGEPALTR